MSANGENKPQDNCRRTDMRDNGMLGGIYFMSFIGAAIYFIQHATSFWNGVLGFIMALFWPVSLMYKILMFLKV